MKFKELTNITHPNFIIIRQRSLRKIIVVTFALFKLVISIILDHCHDCNQMRILLYNKF